METTHEFCPDCGAQVYPDEVRCPFCGRSLRSHRFRSAIIGLSGVALAVFCGALVWWVLDAPPTREVPAVEQAGAPVDTARETPPDPAQDAVATTGPDLAASSEARVAPEDAAAPALPSPFAPAPDQTPFAPSPQPLGNDTTIAAPAAAPVVEVQPSGLASPPLVTQTNPAAPQQLEIAEGDPESRRAFAKSKQDSFAQNGLDLQVTTSGSDDTTLVIKFNFAAKTAVELIVAGPFPKQCAQRGFTEIVFLDPSGFTWVYDIATRKLTAK